MALFVHMRAGSDSKFVKLAIAFVLALPVAWDRERSKRRLGMRTVPLVAIGSCGFMLIGQSIEEDRLHHQREEKAPPQGRREAANEGGAREGGESGK